MYYNIKYNIIAEPKKIIFNVVNKQKLNEDKTELIFVMSPHQTNEAILYILH